MALRRVVRYPISLSGAGTTNLNLDPMSYSRAVSLVGEIIITSAATAAGDTLTVRLQETPDGVQWDTRWCHTAQVGNSGASTTAPESERVVLQCDVPLQTAERLYEPTGSAGGTDLSAGTVRNGPLLGRRRAATAPGGGLSASHRLQFVVAQTSAAAFTGTYTIWLESEK